MSHPRKEIFLVFLRLFFFLFPLKPHYVHTKVRGHQVKKITHFLDIYFMLIISFILINFLQFEDPWA